MPCTAAVNKCTISAFSSSLYQRVCYYTKITDSRLTVRCFFVAVMCFAETADYREGNLCRKIRIIKMRHTHAGVCRISSLCDVVSYASVDANVLIFLFPFDCLDMEIQQYRETD